MPADFGLTKNAAILIGKALRRDSCHTTLDLSSNNLGNQGFMAAISQALTVNRCLVNIGLLLNQTGGKGAFSIAKALKINCTIALFDISFNSIGGTGALAIWQALRFHSCMKSMSLKQSNR